MCNDIDPTVAVEISGRERRRIGERRRHGGPDRSRGHIGPVAPDISKQARASGRQQQEVEQAIVVVVEKLRGAGVGRLRRGGRVVKRPRLSLKRHHADAGPARKEEVRIAVLVDIPNRRHRGHALIERQADARGHVAKCTVAEIPEE